MYKEQIKADLERCLGILHKAEQDNY
ncbi:hypothetical protein ACE41H_00235 [Paenibacillus enshidis]|uniref:Uncharacterized protein n=1 Tax=Paenibacillus enshidis TaxID=1458439 RepID=A0ABV5AM39_9BACL